MKNTKYIIILFLILFCANSCKKAYDEGNINNKKTVAAKLIYDETQRTLNSYINTLELARNVDKYLQSTGKDRDTIKYDRLPSFSIQETDKAIYLENYDSKWIIYRDNKDSIGIPSTKWRIEHSSRGSQTTIPEDGFIITAQPTDNTWRLDIEEFSDKGQNRISSASLIVVVSASTSSNSSNSNYSITTVENTVGTVYSFSEKDKNEFRYTYKTNLSILYNSMRFYGGELEMVVMKDEDSKVDDIAVKIYESYISIDFRGITEKWDWLSDDFYNHAW